MDMVGNPFIKALWTKVNLALNKTTLPLPLAPPPPPTTAAAAVVKKQTKKSVHSYSICMILNRLYFEIH